MGVLLWYRSRRSVPLDRLVQEREELRRRRAMEEEAEAERRRRKLTVTIDLIGRKARTGCGGAGRMACLEG